MKKFVLPALFFLVSVLFACPGNAQTKCDCWQQRDATYTEFPFNLDISGPVPVAPYYRNDDAYQTTIVTLPFSFCFYGSSVNQIYVDNNGWVAWGPGAAALYGGSSSYEPETFPINSVSMIAPFWSDEDMRNVTSGNEGVVWMKTTPTYIIIQWDTCSYYGTTTSSQDNTFQMIISNGTDPIIPNGNNIEFCYKQMTWAVGNAQSGTGGFNSSLNPAVVGINQGNGTGNIQYGRFNLASSGYTGPYPTSPYDGVYWLDNRELMMNGCTGNAPPLEMSGGTACDTLKICEGDTTKASYLFYSVLTGSNVTTVLAPPALSGVSIIYNNASGPSDSVVVQIVGNTLNSGVHTIVLYSMDGLSPADTLFTDIVIDISPAPVVTINAVPDTICLGNSSVLTAGGGLTYLWSNGGTTSSITVTPTVTTTYSVAIATSGCTKDTEVTVVVEPPVVLTVTPLNTGVCAGDSLALIASGATTYTWAPNSGLSCYTCSSPKASPTVSTVYTITGTSNGCSSTITDSVNIYPLPTVTATSTADSICTGQSANLLAAGATTYTWAPSSGLSCTTCANPVASPTVSTVYTVIGSTSHGCNNSATVSIFVAPPPVVNAGPDKSICPGESTTLTATGNGTSFTWQPGNISGPIISVSPATTQIYTVSLSTGCGASTATVTVIVNPRPVPSFTSDINSGCSPLCLQFRDLSTLTAGTLTAWNWKFGNGDSINSQNPIYCYPNPGLYTVTLDVTSDSGCSSTLAILNMIRVYTNPVASFSITPQPTTMLDPEIHFINKSTDAYGIAYYFWTFGENDDTASNVENPTHTYHDTGTFCAKLVVMNIHGCTDTSISCLEIEPQYTLYIPDAFSPNGDGKNDVFTVKGNDIKSFEMYIFDRWGMQLFHSTDINNGWNGAIGSSGTICQEDTYVYMITVYDSKDKKHSYTGELSLIK